VGQRVTAGESQMKRLLRATHLRATLLAAVAMLAPLSATAAESLAGKTVTINVPVAPGGGYDTYARLVARHIKKHLPGQPTVIVKNMPGAGGIILAGHLYTQAPKDGTEFAVLQDANLFQQLTTNQVLPYDARKFGYLGALEKFVPIVLGNGKIRLKVSPEISDLDYANSVTAGGFKIPGITSLNWGTNVSPEQKNKGFTHCFVLTFATEKDRDGYLPHPEHKAFGKVLGPIVGDLLVIDFWSQE